MNEPPTGRALVYSVIVSVLGCAGAIAIGFFSFKETKSVTTMALPLAIMFAALTLLGIELLSRWWIRADGSFGNAAPLSSKQQIERGFYLFAALFAAVGFAYVSYDLSQSRIVEVFTALVLMLPVGLFVLPIAFRLTRPISALESSAWKTKVGMQVVVIVTIAISLVVNLIPPRHSYPDIEPLREFNIAMELVLLTLSPFSARLLRKRYLEAKALKESEPPDRWEAYKKKLAANE